MSLIVPAPVTPFGDIDIMDRAGMSVQLAMSDEDGTIDISGDDVFFESKTVKKALVADGVGLKLILLPADIEELEAAASTRFAIINESKTPPQVIWEGTLTIRTVD